MQTFLPYPDFRKSLECLDTKRLGKQRVEAMQLVNALERGPDAPWYNHPATQMWKDYVPALKIYHNLAIDVWVKRGYKNNMQEYIIQKFVPSPPWSIDEAFHLSHQSNLVRKLPEHYRMYFPDIPDDLPDIWPSKGEAQ